MNSRQYLLYVLLLLSHLGLSGQNKLFLSVDPIGIASISVAQIGVYDQDCELPQNPDGSYVYADAFTIRVNSTDNIPVQRWEVNGIVVSDLFGGTYTNSFLTHIELQSTLGVETLTGTLRVVAYVGQQEYVKLSYGLHEESPNDSGSVSVTEDGFFPNPIASGATIPKGTKVKLKALPNHGYSFDGWYKDGSLIESQNQELSCIVDRDMHFTVRFEQETSTAHPQAELALTMAILCEAGQRLYFEIANAEDWVYIDLGDGQTHEFMVSDDPEYAMRVYCDAAVDNPTIKIYAKDLYSFQAPSNAIQTISFHQVSRLKELILFENAISQIDLSRLSTLDRLDLSNNDLSVVDLSHQTELSYLALEQNVLSNLNLENNKSLQQIRLDENALTSLTLQGFTQLEELSVAHNKLSYLMIDHCHNLSSIDCSNNNLARLEWDQDMSHLTELYLQQNDLIELPSILMPALKTLDASKNSLKELDLSDYPNLENLTAVACNLSGSIDLTLSPSLYTVDLSNNALDQIQCYGLSNLFTLHISHNEIQQLSIIDCPRLDEVGCEDNQLTEITIRGSKQLTGVDLSDNNLDACALDAFYETLPNRIEEYFPGRIYIACDDTPDSENPGAITSKTALAKSLGWEVYTTRDGLREPIIGDGTGCQAESQQVSIRFTTAIPQGEYIFVECLATEPIRVRFAPDQEPITLTPETLAAEGGIYHIVESPTIEILEGDNLSTIYFTMCQLTALDLVDCPALELLSANSNQLTEINGLTHAPKLIDLSLLHNQITHLTDSLPESLLELRIADNLLTSCDLSRASALTYVDLSQNELVELTLPTESAIKDLNLTDNELTQLLVSDAIQLETLKASKNKLTTVTIAPLKLLKTLELSDNALTELILEEHPKLTTCDLSNNQLDACALDHTFAHLPTLEAPIATGFDLLIKGCPGTFTATTALAVEKHWTPNATGDGTGCHESIDAVSLHNPHICGGILYGTEAVDRITLYELTGIEITSYVLESADEVSLRDLADLPLGTYLISCHYRDGHKETLRWVYQ